MLFDMRPLFQALLSLWAITRSVTGFQGNLLDVAGSYLSVPVIYALFFLAGLSETYGTRAVVLFLNRVGRRPFFIILLLTALTYVVGGIFWTISIAIVLGGAFPEVATKPELIIIAVVMGYIPLLFAFLAFIPYLGPALLYLLQGLSLLTTTLAISFGYGLPFTDAALATFSGWLIFQVLRWFTMAPTTFISRWILRLISGRDVNYSLREVVPHVPLGLQRHRQALDERQDE